MDITRQGALPDKASIHSVETTAIKIALKEIQKRKDKIWVIYTLSELYRVHEMQQNI